MMLRVSVSRPIAAMAVAAISRALTRFSSTYSTNEGAAPANIPNGMEDRRFNGASNTAELDLSDTKAKRQLDPRDARFTYTDKIENPNIAQDLIAGERPIACEERVTWCDGGHAGLGHPKVYINLDKPGTHACGYCGLRFYNTHATKRDQLNIAHIQV